MADCMICSRPAVLAVDAPVTLDGHGAPPGRPAYQPLRILLCAEHQEQYHGAPAG